jgi:hypothetical protein
MKTSVLHSAVMPVKSLQPTTIQTTLYDLISVVRAEIEPASDNLVIATVLHLLNAYRPRFVRSARHFKPVYTCQSAPLILRKRVHHRTPTGRGSGISLDAGRRSA